MNKLTIKDCEFTRSMTANRMEVWIQVFNIVTYIGFFFTTQTNLTKKDFIGLSVGQAKSLLTNSHA